MIQNTGNNPSWVGNLVKAGLGRYHPGRREHLHRRLPTVNAGTLVLSNTGSIGASSAIRLSGSTAVLDVTAAGFTVGSGKTISGIGTVTGNLTVAAGGTLSPGNSVGTFNVGSLTLAASSTLYVEIQWNGNDLVSANGTVTLTDSSLVIPWSKLCAGLWRLLHNSDQSASERDYWGVQHWRHHCRAEWVSQS